MKSPLKEATSRFIADQILIAAGAAFLWSAMGWKMALGAGLIAMGLRRYPNEYGE